eukprot:10689377-Karenia_brevis.AAC.1
MIAWARPGLLLIVMLPEWTFVKSSWAPKEMKTLEKAKRFVSDIDTCHPSMSNIASIVIIADCAVALGSTW